MYDLNSRSFDHSPWISFDLSIWQPVISEHNVIFVTRDSIVYSQEDFITRLYVVKSGRMRVAIRNSRGGVKHIYVAEKGCIIGESAAFAGQPINHEASAITDSTLYKIPVEHYQEVLRGNPDFAYTVAGVVSKKYQVLIEQITQLAFTNCTSRIARMIVYLVKQYGVKTSEGIKIDIRFIHEDISFIANTSRVTVSRTFSRLTDQGLIKKTRGYFYVTDLEGLMELAKTREEKYL